MAFAVHGTSELAFTGAAAGLLVADNPIGGALVGALVVATVIGALGVRERERDSAIGVILAFGLGVGVLLLGYYHGFATAATNILFGNIFGVSNDQLLALRRDRRRRRRRDGRRLPAAAVRVGRRRRRDRARRARPLLGIVFLIVLALTVTAAAQVVGTLLVLSLAITPAAAAQRWSPNPLVVTVLSIGFALVAADGGILASLASTTVKPSVFVTSISFGIYLVSRAASVRGSCRRREPARRSPIWSRPREQRRRTHRTVPRLREPRDRRPRALHLAEFDFRPVADALAERGRVVVRRAYADWSRFDEDRRMLTRHHVELIEIPQRMGVGAQERGRHQDGGRRDRALLRTRLHHDVRARHRRQRLHAARAQAARAEPAGDRHRRRGVDLGAAAARLRRVPVLRAARRCRDRHEARKRGPDARRATKPSADGREGQGSRTTRRSRRRRAAEEADLGVLVTQTLSGLERSAGGPVLASMLKRAILRKDPTFSETDLRVPRLRRAAAPPRGSAASSSSRPGPGQGDPEVSFPAEAGDEKAAFELLRSVVERLTAKSGPPHLSGLKTQLRKVEPDFSEKRFGYGGFLQFCKAARARGLIEMDWDDDGRRLHRPARTVAS